MTACGLDFGTSNTTLGIAQAGEPGLAALEAGELTIPSAIFFGWKGEARIGRAAVAAYVEGSPGRLMRGLKSVLGSSLLDEVTQVGRSRLKFRDVIARYLGEVKRRAETAAGAELTEVVHGRPVHFVDGDPEGDRRSEEALRAIAGAIGFKEVSFQLEPIAAALDYERQIGTEQIALIADIGGGTSDFSLARLSPDRHLQVDRTADILANDGVRIGGTDFDRLLSLGEVMPLLGFRSPMKRRGLDVPSFYFHDLATWSSINKLYDRKVAHGIREVRREASRPELLDRLLRVVEQEGGHTLAMEVEAAKISLSDVQQAALALDWVEPGLEAAFGRDELIRHTGELAGRIAARIAACLRTAGIGADRVEALFLTGGSTEIPHVRAGIVAALPAARIVKGDTFGSVGTGLTIEAARRYGGSGQQAPR